jgi:hypothetical protein
MEEDLRSSGAGLRGFKSHPRHHYKVIKLSKSYMAEEKAYFQLRILGLNWWDKYSAFE